MNHSLRRTDLSTFDSRRNFARGRSRAVFAMWLLLKRLFFQTSIPWPNVLKVSVLRFFGGKLGHGVVIKPRVNIWFPWKLELGNHVWIGEETVLLNFEPIIVGSNCCISQQSFLCAGGHDFRDVSFSYRNAPIRLGDGVWLQARTFLCPGVCVGSESVVVACSFVKDDVPANSICEGMPASPIRSRWMS